MDYETTGLDGRYEYRPAEGWIVKLAGQPTREDLAVMLAALRPATEKVISLRLGKLALHKRMVKVSEGGIGTLLSDYARHLAHLPEYAIHLAIEEILTTKETDFFPQLATVLKLAGAHAEKLKAIHERMEGMMRNLDQVEGPGTAQARAERKEQHKQRLAEHLKRRWKTLPRQQWFHADWEHYIHDAQVVADAFRNAESPASLAEWQAEADKRRAEYQDAYPEELRRA